MMKAAAFSTNNKNLATSTNDNHQITTLMTFTYGIKLHVWGDLACFTRPELKSERMSYEVMTPSAARGILSAIYWKPEFNWVVDRIHVLKPIAFTQIRRNEIGRKMAPPSRDVMAGKPARLGICIEQERQQRASTLLRDVGYVIEAHVEILSEEAQVNSIAKHLEMFKRRARKGQSFHAPCLGTRELLAMFSLIEDEGDMPSCELAESQRNCSLGLMLHDFEYHEAKGKVSSSFEVVNHAKSSPKKRRYKKITASPRFFMARLEDGVLHVPPFHTSHS